jgi:outer membrane receptor protein involved in Fe transport
VYSKDKFQFYASGAYNTMVQKMDLDRAQVIDNKFDKVLPEVSMNYEYKKGSSIRLKYEKETALPSVRQVSPVVNDFNPLYIIQGNSALTPEVDDEYSLRAYSHNFKSAGSFFSYFNYTKTSNAIVTNRTIDDNYIQHTTYENYGSRSTLRGIFHFNKKIIPLG